MTEPPEISDRSSALRYLFGHIDYERAARIPYRSRQFKLDRMRELLRALGNPHRRLPIVHVAGTKGKGSTATIIATVLQAAGYSTGLFTSPHLERLEERFRIDGQPCPEDEFVRLVRQVRRGAERSGESGESGDVTYFELTTAMAMLYFVDQEVDVAVIEVGLGGRLDSTNVCRPLVSVITSISLDHTRQLGNTLELIAAEKAGIIKPETPVVSGVSDPGPSEVIQRIATERRAPLLLVDRDFGYRYRGTSLRAAAPTGATDPPRLESRLDYWRTTDDGGRREQNDLLVGMPGRHQAANAAVALAALSTLTRGGWPVAEQAVVEGLRRVECPARIEVIGRSPVVVLDTAHNAASIEALLAVLSEAFPGRRRALVFAASKDKDARQMLDRLLPEFDHLVITRFHENPRWTPPAELASIAGDVVSRKSLGGTSISVTDDPADAWRQARSLIGPDDLICITGSFFLASEIRGHVLEDGRLEARGSRL